MSLTIFQKHSYAFLKYRYLITGHVTYFTQLEIFTSAQHCYDTLKFVYDIDNRLKCLARVLFKVIFYSLSEWQLNIVRPI